MRVRVPPRVCPGKGWPAPALSTRASVHRSWQECRLGRRSVVLHRWAVTSAPASLLLQHPSRGRGARVGFALQRSLIGYSPSNFLFSAKSRKVSTVRIRSVSSNPARISNGFLSQPSRPGTSAIQAGRDTYMVRWHCGDQGAEFQDLSSTESSCLAGRTAQLPTCCRDGQQAERKRITNQLACKRQGKGIKRLCLVVASAC